jgi:hypothetical protein
MTNRKPAVAIGFAIALVGCSAGVAAESPAPESSTAGPTASEDTATVCVGRNAQDIDVPMPAAGWGLAWNEASEVTRMAHLVEVFAPDGTHVQPEMDVPVTSIQELNDHIGTFIESRPGEYFEWTGWEPWYVHHDRILMPWRLCGPDGTVLLEGIDVGIIGGPGTWMTETTSFYPEE